MISGIILAGGNNSRIGKNKAFLEINNEKMIDKSVKLFKELFDEVIIVTNEPEKYSYLDVKLTKDIVPKRASIIGLYSGLKASKNKYNFVIACDMPYPNKELIQYLCNIKDYDIVMPKIDDNSETLFAVYSKNCIKNIEKMIDADNLKIQDLLNSVRVKFINKEIINKIDSKNLSFFNINTQEDLEISNRLL